MNCEEARGLQVDRLLDSVDATTRARLKEHESTCSGCRQAAKDMHELWANLEQMRPPPTDSRSLIRFGRRMGGAAPVPTRVRTFIAAGMVAMLSAGAALGRATATPGTESPAVGGAHFMLALRGVDPNDGAREERVREYTAWADELYDRGQLVTGAELAADGGRWLGLPVPVYEAGLPLNGFFIVVADDYNAAAAVARTSPHLAYGGAIEIRRIVESP